MPDSRENPKAPLFPKPMWSVPMDDFIGAIMIGEMFSIDGRDEEHEIIFDAGYTLEPYWISEDGVYSVHTVPDWEPVTVVLVHSESDEVAGFYCDEVVGFYSGGQLWIDEEHRGRKLSTEMILACTDWYGRSPTLDSDGEGQGFTEAGYQAHARAYIIAVERALAAGLDISSHDDVGDNGYSFS